MKRFQVSKHFLIVISILLIFYFGTHLFGLTRLPVFADEAIYIRWSQLILDEPARYLFFALNDGKTPLFIWQLVPFISVFNNPLFGARLLAVLGGLLQTVAIVWFIKELKGGKMAQLLGALMTMLLPFWFFHHRMALMDGWLSVWLTLTLVALLKAINLKSAKWAVFSGLFLGASFLTKVPAVLFIPALAVMTLFRPLSKSYLMLVTKQLALSTGIGLLIFGLLGVSPAFPQLFARGGDFLYSLTDVTRGIWLTTVFNVPNYLNYFWHYATPGGMILAVLSVFVVKNKRMSLVLIASFLSFCIPIALMGKVVFPRYLFPAMIFLTAAAALAAEQLVVSEQKRMKALGAFLLGVTLLYSLFFAVPAVTEPNDIPFVSADRVQYLNEWSSGHGIKQIYEKLLLAAATEKVAVATEGYFGTLPDGLVLYLHNQNVQNIAVEGVGQPVRGIPQYLIDKSAEYDRLWLVVNSHRLFVDLPSNALLQEYCRPDGATCLQLWDLTRFIKSGEYQNTK